MHGARGGVEIDKLGFVVRGLFDGFVADQLRDHVGGFHVVRREGDAVIAVAQEAVHAGFLVNTFQLLRILHDEEQLHAVTAEIGDADLKLRHFAEGRELIHHEHHAVRLIGLGHGAGEEVGRLLVEDFQQRFQALQVVWRDAAIDSLFFLFQRLQVEVGRRSGGVDEWVGPEFEAGVEGGDDARTFLVGLLQKRSDVHVGDGVDFAADGVEHHGEVIDHVVGAHGAHDFAEAGDLLGHGAEIEDDAQHQRAGFVLPEFLLGEDEIADFLHVIDHLAGFFGDPVERVVAVRHAVGIGRVPDVAGLVHFAAAIAGCEFVVLHFDIVADDRIFPEEQVRNHEADAFARAGGGEEKHVLIVVDNQVIAGAGAAQQEPFFHAHLSAADLGFAGPFGIAMHLFFLAVRAVIHQRGADEEDGEQRHHQAGDGRAVEFRIKCGVEIILPVLRVLLVVAGLFVDGEIALHDAAGVIGGMQVSDNAGGLLVLQFAEIAMAEREAGDDARIDRHADDQHHQKGDEQFIQ